MPGGRGGRKKFGHKGAHRHLTNAKEVDSGQEEIHKEKGQPSGADKAQDALEHDASGSGSKGKKAVLHERSQESDEVEKAKGVQHLIDIHNPNRVTWKIKKIDELTLDNMNPRRTHKERARHYYKKLHAQGKTDEAQRNLARLALIREEREEAAEKWEQEKQKKEASKEAVVAGRVGTSAKCSSGASSSKA